MKNILLIEDNPEHAQLTKNILNKLDNMYHIRYEIFECLPQNGQNRESQANLIKNYIKSEIEKNSFDILMIDMLLGDDSDDNPLGLSLIQTLHSDLKDKLIIVYTEMSADGLTRTKTYNQSIGNCLKIVIKPDFQEMSNRTDCSGPNRKKLRKSHNDICEQQNKCPFTDKFLCDMKAIYYELEEEK